MTEVFEESYRHCRGLLDEIREATLDWENHARECPTCELLHIPKNPDIPDIYPCQSGQDILFESITKIQELMEGINGKSNVRKT